MRIKVERKAEIGGDIVYRVWLGNYYQELTNKELIDLFTEITNAVPTASNNVINPTKQ